MPNSTGTSALVIRVGGKGLPVYYGPYGVFKARFLEYFEGLESSETTCL